MAGSGGHARGARGSRDCTARHAAPGRADRGRGPGTRGSRRPVTAGAPTCGQAVERGLPEPTGHGPEGAVGQPAGPAPAVPGDDPKDKNAPFPKGSLMAALAERYL
jgi:hypothetical protein